MDRLTDRTIIVTGAGSGIGRGTALRLAHEGAYVAALDVAPEALESLAAEAAGENLSGTLVTGPVDISSEDSVVTGVGGVITARGGLDAIVNAAGIHYGDHTHAMTLERWNRLLAVNLTARS